MKIGLQRSVCRLYLGSIIALAAVAHGPVRCVAQFASFGEEEVKHPKGSKHQQPLPSLPSSQPPAFTIPIAPLGFAAPPIFFLGLRNSFVSLDFLDDNRLLFTFRVPGLIRRDEKEDDETERQIRALVLLLPSGVVQSESLWTVHDHARYLWMLKNGHFLVRDRDLIQEGDQTLGLKPLLRFPGPLDWMELDPTQQYLVTSSHEPVAELKANSNGPRNGSQAISRATPDVTTGLTVDGEDELGQKDTVVRILRRESGHVMLVSRVRSAVHLPINGEGYVEDLRGRDDLWLINLNYFSGGSRILGHVDSFCAPALNFVADRELVATACDRSGATRLVAVTKDGRELWEHPSSSFEVWQILVRSPDGSRIAHESLISSHPVNAYSPLDAQDIRGQLVEVLDAATGKVALTAMTSPFLDAGGNVAISPSGRRVAVVSDGAIKVFELAAAPALP